MDDPNIKELYDRIKLRTELVLRSIREGANNFESQISEIDDFLLSKMKPRVFSGRDGVEVRTILGFESTCTMLEYYKLTSNAKALTTLSFYEKTIQLKKIVKELSKKNKK